MAAKLLVFFRDASEELLFRSFYLKVTSISTTALEYIGISSDEESLEDFESSNGLNITSAKELFDKFIHQCALSGVREDNINYVSEIFENASGELIANQSFCLS